MMRDTLLAVSGDTFDIGELREEIEVIARAFGEYLARTGVRSGSKHKALGAVGKALQQARAGMRGEALLGYARRVHEQMTGSTFPAGAVEKLDEGLRRLDALLAGEDVPPRAAGEILSRIDYATYYDVRRRGMEFFAGWPDFAKTKGLEPSGETQFGQARRGVLGDQWKTVAEEYLAQSRLAEGLAREDEEDSQ